MDHSEGATESVPVRFTLNGSTVTADVAPTERLVETLRTRLEALGTKVACEIGACGVCTVIRDGRTVPSCLLLTVLVDGADLWTVEGLAARSDLDPLRAALLDQGGVQCGFCTAGQIVSAAAYLDERRGEDLDSGHCSDREEIAERMGGNLCRCTGYYGILRAVEEVIS